MVVTSSQLQQTASAFSRLSLVAAIDVDGHEEEVQLFHGTIAELGTEESCRFVVAVPDDTLMHLKFKVVR